MKNTVDLNNLVADPVDRNVGKTPKYQFTRSGFATKSTTVGKIG
jgi:hypothetical protein